MSSEETGKCFLPRRDPGPLQILRKSEKGEFELDHDAIDSILCHPSVGNKPISLISIIGAYRTGKSFLLNIIIRYLEKKGYENPSWTGEDGEELCGFAWRGGVQSETKGVWMWNRPFIVTKSEEEVAVFLIDVEGHFDTKIGKGHSVIAVLMSMLFSSTTIFNISKRISDPDLEFIELCIDFKERTNRDKPMCPIQAMTFLVRDWPNSHSHPFGLEGGKKYLNEETLCTKQSDTQAPLKRMSDKLHSTFSSMECYLMPHPGLEVEEPLYRGKLSVLDKKFLLKLKEFCDQIANPNNLVLKKDLTAYQLMDLLIRNFDAIKVNQWELLESESFEEMRQNNEASEAFYQTAGKIGRKLDKLLETGHIPAEKFKKEYQAILSEAMKGFRSDISFLGEKGVERQEGRLKKYVELRHFKRTLEKNKLLKLASGNMAQVALEQIEVGERKMEEAMKDIQSHDWNSQLNLVYRKVLENANHAIQDKSSRAGFKEGFELMETSLNCAKGFMKLEGWFKQIRYDDKVYDFKRKVLDELKKYFKEKLFYGEELEKVLKAKNDRYTKEAIDLKRNICPEGANFTLVEDVSEVWDRAFVLLRQRDKKLEPFRIILLELSLTSRKLLYLTMVGERLDGGYASPEVLNELHENVLQQLLPREDDDDPILREHRKTVKKALDQLIEEFKVWNEENKDTFKKVVGAAAAGLGIGGVGASVVVAAGLYVADIAIVTTVGAAVATGVGGAILAGLLVAGGAFATYSLVRDQMKNQHIEEEKNKIEKGDMEKADEGVYNGRNKAMDDTADSKTTDAPIKSAGEKTVLKPVTAPTGDVNTEGSTREIATGEGTFDKSFVKQ